MNAQPKFTPGPWVVDDASSYAGELWISVEHPEVGEVTLAAVRPGCEEASELGDDWANASLIAAAPEMHEALRLYDAYEALPTDRGGPNGPKGRARAAWIAAKNAALAKAEGRQP